MNRNRMSLIVLPVIVLIVLSSILLPRMIDHYDIEARKRELNNPIIDSNYEGWVKVKLSDAASLQLPANWQLISEEDVIYIYCQNIVIGLMGENNPDHVYLEKLSQYYHFPIVSYEWDSYTTNQFGTGAYSYVLNTKLSNEEEKKTTCILFTIQTPQDYWLCLFPQHGVQLSEEAEAIAWSYKRST